jgi:hypothetical protein
LIQLKKNIVYSSRWFESLIQTNAKKQRRVAAKRRGRSEFKDKFFYKKKFFSNKQFGIKDFNSVL